VVEKGKETTWNTTYLSKRLQL